MNTAIIKDELFIRHSAGEFHPESPKRLIETYKNINPLMNSLKIVNPKEATSEELSLVHSEKYIDLINKLRGKEFSLDADTSGNIHSAETAFLAAGTSLDLARKVASREYDNGFALIRPPGHHAENSRAMGFCIFNNIAVAAANLINDHLAKRVLIVDWDIHHGNGTQNMFYDRDDVIYFSTHLYPYYPGTGYFDEIGEGDGLYYTINVPLTSNKTDNDFLYIFNEILHPICEKFHPDIILISAGYDIYYKDPLGSMKVTEEGFYKFTEYFKYLAQKFCSNKLCLFLEGGYNIEGLSKSVYKCIESLLSDKIEPPKIEEPSDEIKAIVSKVKAINKKFFY
ncbi:MAG: histone deacetylase [Deltaproteobacteria bacterium]|nr:histone deacetylase [Deltaproteobacteria bacterium]